MEATANGTCEAMAASGERCRKRKARGRFCLVHAGAQDMRELGRKGGLVKPSTRLRKNVDDELREEARAVLARALRGEEVPKAALDSARSLFAFRASEPPRTEREGDRAWPATRDGHRVTSLADVVTFAAEIGQASPELVAACRVVVDVADAGGARVS